MWHTTAMVTGCFYRNFNLRLSEHAVCSTSPIFVCVALRAASIFLLENYLWRVCVSEMCVLFGFIWISYLVWFGPYFDLIWLYLDLSLFHLGFIWLHDQKKASIHWLHSFGFHLAPFIFWQYLNFRKKASMIVHLTTVLGSRWSPCRTGSTCMVVASPVARAL